MKHRRRFIFLSLFVFFTLLQAQEKTGSLTTEQIADHLYLVTGGDGANTGFYVAPGEVLVIDAKMTPESAKHFLATIVAASSNPVSTIILTHSDRDHVNGLPAMPKGIRIIAHANSRVHMEEALQPGQDASFLPNLTFSDSLTLYAGAVPIHLLHFGPAHTNGDVIVFFPTLRTAFVGDLLFINRDPLIHLAKHGTSFGLVKVLNILLTLDADRFVSGHVQPVSKKEIIELKTAIEEKQNRIRALVAEGKSLSEIKKLYGVDDSPAKPGTMRFPSLAEVIYKELTP
ncbi:MAG: MBL fold metallo-hydrolase [Ignavibacteriales bacterium]|nr:MBL fold metallo-hydrolase [Ignavibacteriales bacterium]